MSEETQAPAEVSPDMTMSQHDEAFENTFLKTLEDASEEKPETAAAPEPEPEATPDIAEEKTEAKSELSPEEIMESPSSANFKKVKQSRDSAIAERDQFKSELAELKEKLSSANESEQSQIIADLKTQVNTLSGELKVTALEKHPEFRQQYEKKINHIVESAKTTVGEEHAARMGELISMAESPHRNSQIEEIMMELSTTQQARMGALLTRMDEVNAERQGALQNADATYAQLMEQQNAGAREAQEVESRAFDEVSQSMSSELEALRPREGDESWNNEVQSRLQQARQIFSGEGNTSKDLIEACHWAACGPKYREMLLVQLELNKRLRGNNADMAEATPSAGTVEGSNDSAPKTDFESQFSEMTGMDITGYR